MLITLRIGSCQLAATALAFNLSHLHLEPPLEVTPFEFCGDFRHQKTTVLGYRVGLFAWSYVLGISVEHRLVTDKWTDTWPQLIPVLASVIQVRSIPAAIQQQKKLHQLMICGGQLLDTKELPKSLLLVHGQVTIIFVVSVGLSVCLCRVFLSRLWSDFDQTRTYVVCLGLVVSPRI